LISSHQGRKGSFSDNNTKYFFLFVGKIDIFWKVIGALAFARMSSSTAIIPLGLAFLQGDMGLG